MSMIRIPSIKPTNRFFYSEKQANLFGQDDSNEVFNGKEWVKYSEWISKGYMDKTCNWDDAVLVFKTEEDDIQIKINPNKLFDYMELMEPEGDAVNV